MSKRFHPKLDHSKGEIMSQDEFTYCRFVRALRDLRNKEQKIKTLKSGVNTGFEKWNLAEIDLEFQKTVFWNLDYLERY